MRPNLGFNLAFYFSVLGAPKNIINNGTNTAKLTELKKDQRDEDED